MFDLDSVCTVINSIESIAVDTVQMYTIILT